MSLPCCAPVDACTCDTFAFTIFFTKIAGQIRVLLYFHDAFYVPSMHVHGNRGTVKLPNAKEFPDLESAVTQAPRASRGFTDCQSFHSRVVSSHSYNVLRALNDGKGGVARAVESAPAELPPPTRIAAFETPWRRD